MLNEYLKIATGKSGVRVAYFGDEYLNDIHATYEFNQTLYKQGSMAHWHPIAIMEEMSLSDRKYEDGENARLVPFNS
jgi:hypothetical protein